MKQPIVIIGAGLSGCYMSILLAKLGYQVYIYERFPKNEIIENAARRSFNLTFFGFGVKALTDADLWEVLSPFLIKLKGSMTQVRKDTKSIYAPLDQDKMPYYCISRSNLIHALLNKIEQIPSIKVFYEKKLLSIDRAQKQLYFEDMNTHSYELVDASVIIGADGVNSIVRNYIQQGQDTKHKQEYAPWSYKQLYFTKGDVERLGFEQNVAYTWTRNNASILEFPNNDKTAVAMFVLPKTKTESFSSLVTKDAIKTFITKQFPSLLPALESLTQSILTNPEGSYVTIHTSPWYYKDSMVLIGDAAHGFLPFFGQGMSAAFGDCIELTDLLNKYEHNWAEVLPKYELNRKEHMDTLGDLSKEGFARYQRESKADFTAIYERLEEIGHRLLPNSVLPPLFEPITNDPSHTADHLRKYKKQKKIASILGVTLLVHTIKAAVLVMEKSQHKETN